MGENVQNKAEQTCINKGRPVYFSYARNSKKQPDWEHISDCVEKLLGYFDKENIEYRLDVRDIGAGDRISDFEREIGWKSEVVVLIFSDKYFRSMHCMYEFVQIKKSLERNPNKRLLCIKSGNFDLSNIRYILDLERYWGDIKQSYDEIEYHRLRAHSGTEKAAFQNGFYMEDVRNLYSFFSAINYTKSEIDDWSFFVNDIKKYYSSVPDPNLKLPVEQPLYHREIQHNQQSDFDVEKVTQPVAEPENIPVPKSENTSVPKSQQFVQPPEPEKKTELKPEQVSESVPEQVSESVPEQVSEPKTEPRPVEQKSVYIEEKKPVPATVNKITIEKVVMYIIAGFILLFIFLVLIFI